MLQMLKKIDVGEHGQRKKSNNEHYWVITSLMDSSLECLGKPHQSDMLRTNLASQAQKQHLKPELPMSGLLI
jgi:hypothetical protein